MVLHVDHLSHILHLVPDSSLIWITGHIHTIRSWSEIGNTRWVKILVLWCWAMSFELIELELVLVWSPTNTSFVDVVGSNSTMRLLFDKLTIQGLVGHLLLRVHLLVVVSGMGLNITWQISLLIVSTCLRSSFKLILYLLLLFFIWITNLYALTYLLELWSIKWVHLLVRVHHHSSLVWGVL